MCHVQSVPVFLDEKIIRSKGIWGLFHEMGHNLQHSGWIIHPHISEAMCNLWSVYVSETVLDIPRNQAHSRLSPQSREQRIKVHVDKGTPLSDRNMWTALETYLQVQSRNGGKRGPHYNSFNTATSHGCTASPGHGRWLHGGVSLWLRFYMPKMDNDTCPTPPLHLRTLWK